MENKAVEQEHNIQVSQDSIQASPNTIQLMPHCQKTYEEMLSQISLYGRSVAVQPTGTGKSSILMKFLQDYSHQWKVVVSPTDEGIKELKSKENWVDEFVITITYQNISKLLQYVGVLDIRLIALDEVHRATAKIWGQNVQEVIDSFPKATVIGFTATPIHYLDGKKDIVKIMFNGISAGNITTQEAILQEILPKPTQVEVMFSVSNDIKKACDKVKKAYSKKKNKTKGLSEPTEQQDNLEEVLDSDAQDVINKLQAYELNWEMNERDSTIINAYTKYIGKYVDKNYKHIVFMPSISVAESMKDKVYEWFTKVYPYNPVNIYVAHSRNKQSDLNIQAFRRTKLLPEIDILIAVNMANESLHIKNTKSVTMLRYTKSPNLFMQQMGRALSIGGEDPIIFDFIGNISALSDVADFIQGIESKVTSHYENDLARQLRANAYKIFDVYDDQTEGFRRTLDMFMCSMPKEVKETRTMVRWGERLEMLKDLLEKQEHEYNLSIENGIEYNKMQNFEEIKDLKLRRWAVEQRTCYIHGNLDPYKCMEFYDVVGELVYQSPSMVQYGTEWFDIAHQLNAGIQTVGTEALKFRIYCNKVPLELIVYMKEHGISVELDYEWFISTCSKHSKILTERFVYVINTIMNNPQIDINSTDFDMSVYLDICEAVLKLRNYFVIYNNREDSHEAVVFNLFQRYWMLNISTIASNIEMDLGALKIHTMLIKKKLGLITQEEDTLLKEQVFGVEERFRAKSISILIERLGIQ